MLSSYFSDYITVTIIYTTITILTTTFSNRQTYIISPESNIEYVFTDVGKCCKLYDDLYFVILLCTYNAIVTMVM